MFVHRNVISGRQILALYIFLPTNYFDITNLRRIERSAENDISFTTLDPFIKQSQ